MNVLRVLAAGYAVLSAVASVASGQPSQPFKIGSVWFTIQEVPAPKK